MCGICGFVGCNDPTLLRRMNRSIQYRGPDDEGDYTDEGVGLANRRLSITALEGGHQPMSSEDGRFWIVYNGEIYNYQEIRAELQKRHAFSTQSDTEVVLHAFEEWGPDCVRRFNGMFAFAIWDTREKQLFLARDRLGIKPLYYSATPEGFVFGSEVKCILHHPDIQRKVNPVALHQILNLSAIISADTMFQNIYKVMPGHSLTYRKKDGRLTLNRYWKPVFDPRPVRPHAAAQAFNTAFESAVRRHMISDVPVGALLSGGLDSSAIVAAMSQASPKPVATFSMGFGGSTDELDDARHVAEFFGTTHTELVIDPLDAFKKYPTLIYHMDQPKVNNAYSYFVYQKVREKVTVCLSGLGGDELFGGYVARHNQIRAAARYRRWMPRVMQHALVDSTGHVIRSIDAHQNPEWDRVKKYLGFLRHANDGASFYLKVGGQLMDDRMLDQVYGPAMTGRTEAQIVALFRPYFQGGHPQNDFLNAELQTSLPDDLLITEDAMSMAHSLEVRVPFLDNELVDFSLALPFDQKYAHGVGKIVVRQAMKRRLPPRVLKKPKAGFGPKLIEWYRRGVRPLAEHVLDNPLICREGIIQKAYIQRILSKPVQARLARHYAMVESLVGLEIWYRTYMGEEVKPLKEL